MKLIPYELDSLRSVAAAVFDLSGTLLEANAGFNRILGATAPACVGQGVSHCFQYPAFRELSTASPGEGGTLYRGAMRMRDFKGGTIHIEGVVTRSAFGICLLADFALDETAGSPDRRSPARSPEEPRVVDATLTDSLTGVGNRAHFDQALAREISRVKRTALPLSMLVGNLDHLARVNEQNGRSAGDALLTRFGFLLRLLTRPTDVSSRLYGDSFAVLMPHTNIAGAIVLVERIRVAFSKPTADGPEHPATVSFGVAEFDTNEDAKTFLNRVGIALGEAKKSGRDRAIAANPAAEGDGSTPAG